MGVFTFVCRSSGGDWNAKQLAGDLESSASSTYELQRKLVNAAVAADSSGGVQSSFSLVTPSSAVFQVGLSIDLFDCILLYNLFCKSPSLFFIIFLFKWCIFFVFDIYC